MRALLKNRPLLLLTIGLIGLAQASLWEFVRVRRDYRFVIEPWSLRGYEFAQGIVITVASLAILVVAWLLVQRKLKETTLHSWAVAGFFLLLALALVVLSNARDVEIPMVGSAVLSLIGMGVIGTVAERLVKEDMGKWAKRGIRTGSRLVAFFVLLFFVYHPVVGGSPHPAWLVALVAFGTMSLIAVLRAPQALSSWRMVINAILTVWVVTITMGSSLRYDLLQAQFDLNQVSADLQDIQITSGVIIAWAAGLIAFVGAVGLWAKRRDEIAARERAQRQQQAARESEQQLAEQPA